MQAGNKMTYNKALPKCHLHRDAFSMSYLAILKVTQQLLLSMEYSQQCCNNSFDAYQFFYNYKQCFFLTYKVNPQGDRPKD